LGVSIEATVTKDEAIALLKGPYSREVQKIATDTRP
jgi:hypothetical protein